MSKEEKTTLNQYLTARQAMLSNQIRNKTVLLKERKTQISMLETEIQQLSGALLEVLNIVNAIKVPETEIVTEEDISDEEPIIDEKEDGDNT